MSRASSVILGVLGAAWMLGGVSTMLQGLDSGRQQAAFAATQLAAIDERTDESVKRLETRRTDVEERENERVEKVRAEAVEHRAAVEEVRAQHQEAIDERQAAMSAAVDEGNKRKLKRAEVALARATKKQEADLRRPLAKLEKAEAAIAAATARRTEKLAAIDEEISDAKAERVTARAAIEETDGQSEERGVIKPAIATLLGVLLIGIGVAMGMGGRRSSTMEVQPEVVSRRSSSVLPAPPMSTEVIRAKQMPEPDDEATYGIQREPGATEVTAPEDPAAATPRITA